MSITSKDTFTFLAKQSSSPSYSQVLGINITQCMRQKQAPVQKNVESRADMHSSYCTEGTYSARALQNMMTYLKN